MKVFISWSGDRSKQLAEAIHWWLPKVLKSYRRILVTERVRRQRLGLAM